MAISQVFYVQTPCRQGLWVLQALPTGTVWPVLVPCRNLYSTCASARKLIGDYAPLVHRCMRHASCVISHQLINNIKAGQDGNFKR